jgi:hypothetical protein
VRRDSPPRLELSGAAPDSSRIVIGGLRPRLQPGDEILVSYEDAPFFLYTDQPIRGGIAAWRRLPIEAPDVPFSDNADPNHRYCPLAPGTPSIGVFERVADGAPGGEAGPP